MGQHFGNAEDLRYCCYYYYYYFAFYLERTTDSQEVAPTVQPGRVSLSLVLPVAGVQAKISRPSFTLHGDTLSLPPDLFLTSNPAIQEGTCQDSGLAELLPFGKAQYLLHPAGGSGPAIQLKEKEFSKPHACHKITAPRFSDSSVSQKSLGGLVKMR